MQSKSEARDSSSASSSKIAYSCYFETKLELADFGKSRKKHNRICNQQLLKQLEGLNKEGIQLCTEVTNEELITNIRSFPQNPPHESLVWEHCSTATVIYGTEGVMRLVPKVQHTSGTEYWQLFHPDHNNRGGYHEWAIPNGAPVDKKSRNLPASLKPNQIEELRPHELADPFLLAVKTNNYKKFELLLDRAKQLSLSKSDLGAILTKSYTIGFKKESLLHLAIANGNMKFIDILINHFAETPNFLQRINYQGSTPAHIAAENNRPLVLRHLVSIGADLTIKNKKKETVLNIVEARNYSTYPPNYQQTFNSSLSHDETKDIIIEQKQSLANSMRDPQFVYGDRSNYKQSGLSNSLNAQEPRKTYRERIGLMPLTEAECAEQQKANLQYKNLLKQIEQGDKKIRTPSLLGGGQDSRKTYRERIGLKPISEAERVEYQRANNESKNKQIKSNPLASSTQKNSNIQRIKPQSFTLFAPKNSTENSVNTHKEKQKQLQKQVKQQEQKRLELQVFQKQKRDESQKQLRVQSQKQKLVQAQQRIQSQAQPRAQPQAQQKVPLQASQKVQLKVHQSVQPQQRVQPQAQQRVQPQAQQRVQPQAQQRVRPQAQQQIAQRAQQQAAQRAQQQAAQRAQQQAAQRAQQQAAQRAQQQAAQRAQQ
ncbi:MAG: ankyrin repeat domain-containing protein, partial [Tatlockia sp.]|nr:ankyrin repeat domain-containing protein [Tatlockia sp.]